MMHEQEDFDQRLRRGLRITPPPGLEGRIRARVARRRHAALLGGVLGCILGAGVAGGILAALLAPAGGPPAGAAERWSRALAAHVRGEPQALAGTRVVDPARAARVVAAAGFPRLAGADWHPGAPLLHASSCRIDGRRGAHLVLRAPEGPVTVLVVPARLPAPRLRLRDGDLAGSAAAIAGGTVAVLGSAPDRRQRILRTILDAAGRDPRR